MRLNTPRNKKFLITPSDWIIFLQGMIATELNIMLAGIAAIVLVILTLIQLSIITGDMSFISLQGVAPSITNLAFEWLFVLIFIFIFIMILIRPKQRLCNKIIRGELTNHKDILQAYDEMNKFEIKIEKKSKEK